MPRCTRADDNDQWHDAIRAALTSAAEFLDGKQMYGQEEIYRRFVLEGIWQFGMEPDAVEALLNRYGWHLNEHIGGEELMARYVRPTGRTLASTPIERMVYAAKL
jgi:O-methyltransferase involved in polyketide biosynthesis